MKEKEENIYIKALEYGVEKMDEGISYNEIIKHLKDSGFEIKGNFSIYFKTWYYLTFFNYSRTLVAKQVRDGVIDFKDFTLNTTVDDVPNILMSEGYLAYMDYKELVEARISSRRAHIIATYAIVISAFLAFGAIVIQLFFNS